MDDVPQNRRSLQSGGDGEGDAVHRFGPGWIPQHVDVKAIRASLSMTQTEFAEHFGFSTGTIRNWEQGHRQPDRAARVLLTVVANQPDAVARSLEMAKAEIRAAK